MWIRKIGNSYYWYHSQKENGKNKSIYLRKATREEVKLYEEKKRNTKN